MDKRADQTFRQGFTGTGVAAGGSANKSQVPLLPEGVGGSKLVPYLG